VHAAIVEKTAVFDSFDKLAVTLGLGSFQGRSQRLRQALIQLRR
jgi:hypothetical protein